MLVADVNVLVDAHRLDAPRHVAVRAWLAAIALENRTTLITADRAFGLPRPALAGSRG